MSFLSETDIICAVCSLGLLLGLGTESGVITAYFFVHKFSVLVDGK